VNCNKDKLLIPLLVPTWYTILT